MQWACQHRDLFSIALNCRATAYCDRTRKSPLRSCRVRTSDRSTHLPGWSNLSGKSLGMPSYCLLVDADTELSIFGLRCRIADDQRRRRRSQMAKGFDADMAGQVVGRHPGQTNTGINRLGVCRRTKRSYAQPDATLRKPSWPWVFMANTC